MTGQLVPFPNLAPACVTCGASLAAIASHPNTGQCHPCWMAERTAPELPAPVTDRDAAIAAIRAGLRRRSGRAWSVTGGRGTSWGWIRIHALPARRVGYGYMSDADRAELGQLLGLDRVHQQGASIPAGSDYRTEYVDRAEGRTPRTHGTPYWD